MSAYTSCKTKIKSKLALQRALAKLGFAAEVHKKAARLKGYLGDKREETAEVIIRRENIGASSNDVGFKKQPDGTYKAIISEYDRSQFDNVWLDKLHQTYAEEVVRHKGSRSGFSITKRIVKKDGTIEIELSR